MYRVLDLPLCHGHMKVPGREQLQHCLLCLLYWALARGDDGMAKVRVQQAVGWGQGRGASCQLDALYALQVNETGITGRPAAKASRTT